MDFFSVLTLVGGLAMFLYGMQEMSAGLEQLAGGRLQSLLQKMTANPFKGLLLGCGVTAVMQSSSAVTVMLVGLVNSGILTFHSSVSILMGSNIGTTVTAWILSLAGLSGDNFFVSLFKPESLCPIAAGIGVLLVMLGKSSRPKAAGKVLLGFALLMYGMEFMKDSVSPLSQNEGFTGLLTAFNNPILGVLVGALITAIIQSSSASVGILQAIAMTGSISYRMAIPIIMGQNIGTCVTSLISSANVGKDAKRVAVLHLSFNVIGTVVFLLLFMGLDAVIHLPFLAKAIDVTGTAIVHTVFNVATTALLLPFTKQLEQIACRLVRGKKEEKPQLAGWDERLLASPAYSVSYAEEMGNKLAGTAVSAVLESLDQLSSPSEKRDEAVRKAEAESDALEDGVSTILTQLNGKPLSDEDSMNVSLMLNAIGDFERISDYAVNMLDSAKEMQEKQLQFSTGAAAEFEVVISAAKELLVMTRDCYLNRDHSLAARVEPLEQVINDLLYQVKTRHIARLKAGSCDKISGFVLSDLICDIDRVAAHCSNIAVGVLLTESNEMNVHAYFHNIKDGTANDSVSSRNYRKNYEQYRRQYLLP